ncbi:hypothetical protein WQ57_23425 [Mesobacillus campisalis]|jgi:hypothetical protein|uniref:DUF2922 domain-containing protein n=1 Tax=Mesobacillus campisalis TaxID=1408103 RepID=A0A0M2SFR7_9BACI|nr:DUF2922 domain-containing protein [Mesobacillus campisalis]KKK33574.1 hypothetical protein WQ57_23425 [Mesobacillus campisalis]
MARVLELHFVTNLGKIARINVDHPKEPVDPATVKLAMEQMIASNAFFSNVGDLTAVSGARVVERNVTKYEL